MRVIPVPCLSDNYAYLVMCEETGQAGVIDPSEAPPVLAEIKRQGVTLSAILNTHHHWDHVGGNNELLRQSPALAVYGHQSDRGRIDGLTQGVEAGQRFPIGALEVSVLHTPGHTAGSVSYVIEDAVFTGDTLFAGGCGRIFEGTAEMMYRSLNEVIGALPRETKVYFGHEYTETNLRFASAVEPDNRDVEYKLAAVRKLRQEGKFTTPSTLDEEWRTNPFLRTGSDTLKAHIQKAGPSNDLSPVSVLGALREMKNRF